MSNYLTAGEMASLRRALAKRTGGSVSVGTAPITVAQGIAIWNAATSFEASTQVASSGLMRLPRRRVRRHQGVHDAAGLHHVLKAGIGVAAVASLAGCTTMFGGNVKGSFSCRAPDGICAPTSKIDDAALALISGDTSLTPAGPYMRPPAGSQRQSVTASAEPVRSGEKVLRIVFPAHIDASGRFREATAIHAVVERGEWIAAANTVRGPSAVSMQQAVPSPSQALADPLPVMQTLGELASAAPELEFPSAVSDIDAQNAAAAQETSAPALASPGPVKTGRRRAKQVSVAASPAAVAAAAPSASAASAASGNALSSRPVVSNATPDPVAAIREQVAARLSKGTSRSSAARQTPVGGLQPPATAQSSVLNLLASGTGANPSSASGGALEPLPSLKTVPVPSAEAKLSAGSAAADSSTPINGPSLFPVSDVHP
jgi:conjugal transfer pilus assembly protein TraV